MHGGNTTSVACHGWNWGDWMIEVRLEKPSDAEIVRKLLDMAFGPDRFRKTVYRLREGTLPVRSLCLVAEYMGEVRGSLRFWSVRIGGDALVRGTPALLLGPLAIDPGIRGRRVGVELMNEGLRRARAEGHEIVVLVGDPEYYGQFGFTRTAAETLALPGPVEDRRFLATELVPGALDGIGGMIGRDVPDERAPDRVATGA